LLYSELLFNVAKQPAKLVIFGGNNNIIKKKFINNPDFTLLGYGDWDTGTVLLSHFCLKMGQKNRPRVPFCGLV